MCYIYYFSYVNIKLTNIIVKIGCVYSSIYLGMYLSINLGIYWFMFNLVIVFIYPCIRVSE